MHVRIRHSESRRALIADVASWIPEESGWAVANLLARRYYGRRGHARTCRPAGWATDGSYYRFEAFIGVPSRERGSTATVGRDIWFDIYDIEPVADVEDDYLDDEPVPDDRAFDDDDDDDDDDDIEFSDLSDIDYPEPFSD